VVTGIGLAAAEQIMFAGITSLPERATFLPGAASDRGKRRGDLRGRVAAARLDDRGLGRGRRADRLLSGGTTGGKGRLARPFPYAEVGFGPSPGRAAWP
jgi:hypothetical protein